MMTIWRIVFVLLVQAAALLQVINGDCFPAVFSFGDSKADTGNVRLQQSLAYPYGTTFPGGPFNRFSDGRLVVDWMQLAYNLPFLEPSMSLTGSFSQGSNFAANAAQARTGLPLQFTQYVAFKGRAAALGATGYPPASAFVEGLHVISIGENDYRQELLILGKSFDQVAATVPDVVGSIINATEKLYSTGARRFFIVGIAKDGCTPIVAARYENDTSVAKDQYGCVVPFDNIVKQHNSALLAGVVSLRSKYPNGTFIYGDYFGNNLDILQRAKQLGFTSLVAACCGDGGPTYNYNALVICGVTPGFQVCPNPKQFLNWDGIHFTDHFYGVIARNFLSGRFVNTGGKSLTPGCTPNFNGFYSI